MAMTNRREFLRLGAMGAAALAMPGLLRGADGGAGRRPNVIVILTDDQGSVDAGCYGAKDLATPNIDALARQGVRFTQFYAAASVCSASRAGLLTGRYPLRTGMTGNAASQRGQAGAMAGREITMAEMFKAAGYATGHVGKWHLGYTPDTSPTAQGFDFSFGHMGGCIDNYSHYFYWQGPNVHDLQRNGTEVYESGRFFPDLLVEEASKFMTANRERPFFLYFAINVPHYPYQPDQKWLEHYKDMPMPRRLYAAFVSTMDDRVGRLLKKVDELGLRENTIVVLQSDNGHSTEERAFFGGGNAGPYRGAKFSLFEGGIRMPAVISWPGHLPEGAVRGQLAHACDWLPTLAELSGVKVLNQDLDGKSIVGMIKSEKSPTPHDVVHWHMPPQWAVREGDWKLVFNARDTSTTERGKTEQGLFLVNLAEDVGEKRNVAGEHPEIAQRMLKLHEDWVKRCGG